VGDEFDDVVELVATGVDPVPSHAHRSAADQHHHAALTIRERLATADPDNVQYQRDLGYSDSVLARGLAGTGLATAGCPGRDHAGTSSAATEAGAYRSAGGPGNTAENTARG
jgi:hypothetical protein